MTQESETIPQAAPPKRITPSFTVIVEKTESTSFSGSQTISGTLGNGKPKPTHVFKIMANGNFPKALKFANGNPLGAGVFMLMVHKLNSDGTHGDMVLGWEKNPESPPPADTPETAELKAAMMWDIFTEFGYNPSEPLPEKKPQVTEENAEPGPGL
jgi:hypothetical protein